MLEVEFAVGLTCIVGRTQHASYLNATLEIQSEPQTCLSDSRFSNGLVFRSQGKHTSQTSHIPHKSTALLSKFCWVLVALPAPVASQCCAYRITSIAPRWGNGLCDYDRLERCTQKIFQVAEKLCMLEAHDGCGSANISKKPISVNFSLK